MLIVCPSCATSYDVELASLLPEGRYVRCLRCRVVWHAAPSHADKLLAAAAALGSESIRAEGILEAPGQGSLPEAISTARSDNCVGDVPVGAPPVDGGSFAAAADEQSEEGLVVVAADGPEAAMDGSFLPIAPVDLDRGRPLIEIDEDRATYSAPPLEAIRSFAGWPHLRRGRRWSPPRWPMSRLHTGILALLIVDCFLVGWRSDVVRAVPQSDAFYKLVGLPVNLGGLAFKAITTTTEQHEGVPILTVEGNIVNGTDEFLGVPRVKFIVRNAARQEIYSWTAVASRTLLPPGEAVSFRTRLASPPPAAHDVLLRFVDRRDIVAAAR